MKSLFFFLWRVFSLNGVNGFAGTEGGGEDVVARVGLDGGAVAEMVPAAFYGYAPAVADGELHIEGFGEMEVGNATDATVGVHQVLEHVPLKDGVAVGLGEESESDARAQPQDKMRQADERDIEIEIGCYGVSEKSVLSEAPVTEPHAHACLAVGDRVAIAVCALLKRDRPVVQGLPLRVEGYGEVSAYARSRPCPFVAHHHIDFAVGHDGTCAEHGTAVKGEFRLHVERGQQKEKSA